MKKGIPLYYALLLILFPCSLRAQTGLQKVTAHVFTRQAENGYVSSISGDLYYTRNGNLVSNFTTPKSYIMVTNSKGEVKVYDPKENTVMQFQNTLFSSSATPFYYFLSGKTGDMGLQRAGYRIVDTKFDKNQMITLWKIRTPDAKDPIVYIKLVHEGNKPIYMDYEDARHKILRKVFYYDYTSLDGIPFPGTFTEILYQQADSVITKTEYSAFRVNQDAKSSFFDFKIPEHAKLVKQ